MDEGPFVICRVCNKKLKMINITHLKTHNLTIEEYLHRFPDARLRAKQLAKPAKIKERSPYEFEEVSIEDFEDIPLRDVDPIDEIELEAIESSTDICSSSKNRVLDHLRNFFSNVQKDYLIQISHVSDKDTIIFECITDFADPVLKVDIEFPNTFWHNQTYISDPVRKFRLQEFGWYVIEIGSTNPSFDEIKEEVTKLFSKIEQKTEITK